MFVVEFDYNSVELRVQKKVTANGETRVTDYVHNGKHVTEIRWGNETLHFFYDAQGRPAKVSCNGELYTYVHNLQGDIISLLDNSGNLVVVYKYDAWDKLLSTIGTLADSLGKRNPFRYRGYVYDEETKLYYLRSRYYDSVVGRFLNADTRVDGTGSAANVYCYCNNSSVKFIDLNGCYGESVVPVPTVYPTPAPSRPITWDEDFEQRYYFSAAGVFYYGEPNSYRAWQNSRGEWYERWYGDDGTPIMDRHWTDHGNSKKHPFVPHDEDWKDDGKGKKTIDKESTRPSPEGVKKPTKATPNDEFSIDWSSVKKGATQVLVFLIGAGIFVLSGGSTSMPVGVFA